MPARVATQLQLLLEHMGMQNYLKVDSGIVQFTDRDPISSEHTKY